MPEASKNLPAHWVRGERRHRIQPSPQVARQRRHTQASHSARASQLVLVASPATAQRPHSPKSRRQWNDQFYVAYATHHRSRRVEAFGAVQFRGFGSGGRREGKTVRGRVFRLDGGACREDCVLSRPAGAKGFVVHLFRWLRCASPPTNCSGASGTTRRRDTMGVRPSSAAARTPAESRLRFPPLPSLPTRCDRGPVALRGWVRAARRRPNSQARTPAVPARCGRPTSRRALPATNSVPASPPNSPLPLHRFNPSPFTLVGCLPPHFNPARNSTTSRSSRRVSTCATPSGMAERPVVRD